MPTNKKIIRLAENTINSADMAALASWLISKPEPQLTKGPLTEEFEKQWARYTGTEYAVMVNSGSSANLLAIYSLIATDRLRNNKVVVPALSWITDIGPVMQFGLTPILCDCNLQDLSVDLNMLEDIFKTESPACMILVCVLGLVPNMTAIRQLCDKYSVILMLDNCEGIGSMHKDHMLEEYADFSTCSLYYGHHMSTIEGGMISTNDWHLYNALKMLRSHGWDRDVDNKDEAREHYKVTAFEAMYKFYYPGFNLRATDLQAFIGLRQLQKTERHYTIRNQCYNIYWKMLNRNIWKPANLFDDLISPLGYPVLHEKRTEIVKELQENNVEVRPLICGSMGNQPFYVNKYGSLFLKNADYVDKNGFYVPIHPFLKDEDVHIIVSIINKHTN